jgi:hypothetical protein
MDLTTGMWVGIALFLLFLVPYLVLEIRRGKKHGHSRFNWFKPRGHSDVARVDEVERLTRPSIDEARGVRR